jgi:hypothetical protein
MTYASAFIPSQEINSVARSVRIPVDRRQVVMTADGIVACKSLTTGVGGSLFPSAFVNADELRPYPVIRDSLEVTDTRAVALSKNTLNPSGEQGRATIFDITTAGSLALIGMPHELGVIHMSNRAHDLAISPDGTLAVVKAEEANFLILGLNGAPSVSAPILSMADPLDPLGPFVSDSVVISADGTTAIVIGAHFNPPPGNGLFDGITEFISLPTGVTLASVNSQPGGNIFAADLRLTRDSNKVLVRYKTAVLGVPPLPPGDPAGQDFVLYNLAGVIQAKFAAGGDTFRLDDIEVGGPLTDGVTGTAIGIGETLISNPIPVAGRVQLFWFF